MRAVDMPINQSVEETLEKVRAIVKQNQYKKNYFNGGHRFPGLLW